jgi:ABC-type transport system involved in multi-copper enzyme maturation permease subunit
MKNTVHAFRAEFLKFRRTKVFWATVAAMVFITLMCSFLMYVSLHPDIALKAGIIGQKAKLFGKSDWPAYLSLLAEMASMGGSIFFGFAASWVFGREYSDKTVKDLLARPVSRSSVVAAKFLIVVLWSAVQVATMAAAGLLAGWAAGLPGWSADAAARGFGVFFVAALLEIPLAAPVAFFASAGKGYLLPLGFVILTLILANLSGMIGFGPWFPWAVPGLYSQNPADLNAASYLTVAAASLLGLAGTFAWWRYADQK